MRVAIILPLLLVALYVVGLPDENYDLERFRNVDTKMSYASLPLGVTAYELAGPMHGPVVVLVHGGREPARTWDHVVPVLHQRGLRTLRYDLYGRGLSDRLPNDQHNRSLYVRQLQSLLNFLQFDQQSIHLMAYSFGSVVAAEYTARMPTMVKGLTLIAPRYFALDKPFLLYVPLLNNFLIKYLVKPQALDEVRGFVKSWDHLHKVVGSPAQVIGTQQAFKAFVLSDALADTRLVYQTLQATNVAVSIVWGVDDSSSGPDHGREIKALLPRATVVAIEDADHGLVWSKASQCVVAALGTSQG